MTRRSNITADTYKRMFAQHEVVAEPVNLQHEAKRENMRLRLDGVQRAPVAKPYKGGKRVRQNWGDGPT